MIPLIESHRDQIETLCRRFQVQRLDVFGSAVTGTFDEQHSDVDFVVEFSPEAEPQLANHYLDLIAALRDLLGRPVDVVMSRAIRNPYFQQVIDQQRSNLYAA